MDERIGTSVHIGALIAALGVFAWASGLPAVFPSPGPSALVLAAYPETEASDPRRPTGTHDRSSPRCSSWFLDRWFLDGRRFDPCRSDMNKRKPPTSVGSLSDNTMEADQPDSEDR